jgi:hypothetical protein
MASQFKMDDGQWLWNDFLFQCSDEVVRYFITRELQMPWMLKKIKSFWDHFTSFLVDWQITCHAIDEVYSVMHLKSVFSKKKNQTFTHCVAIPVNQLIFLIESKLLSRLLTYVKQQKNNRGVDWVCCVGFFLQNFKRFFVSVFGMSFQKNNLFWICW